MGADRRSSSLNLGRGCLRSSEGTLRTGNAWLQRAMTGGGGRHPSPCCPLPRRHCWGVGCARPPSILLAPTPTGTPTARVSQSHRIRGTPRTPSQEQGAGDLGGLAACQSRMLQARCPPLRHSPPCCRRSGHRRGLRRAGPLPPGRAAGESWWPGLGSGCRQGRVGSRYLDRQRDRRMHGVTPRDVGSQGLRSLVGHGGDPHGALVAAGGRACLHGAALRQTHILHEAVGAPGLRRPPPGSAATARCERKRCAKAVAGSGPGAGGLQTSPVGPCCGENPRPSSPCSRRDVQRAWGHHAVPVQGDGDDARPHPAPGILPSHPRATSYPPIKPQHYFFRPLFRRVALEAPVSLSPPWAGAVPPGRMSPSCLTPSCDAREGAVGVGCRDQPGAGCRQGTGNSWMEAGDGVSTAVAALPAHAPTPAPLPVSPWEMLRQELCMRHPAGKIPTGPARTRCPRRGQGAHGGDRVPTAGTFSPAAGSPCDGSEPTWGQRSRRASRWLRCCRLEGGRATLALRRAAGAAQGRVGGRRGAAVGCFGQRRRALQGKVGVRDGDGDPWGPSPPSVTGRQRLT